MQWFWGAPNFGENPKTDKHYQGWVLKLDHPLLVQNDPYLDQNLNNMLRSIQIRVEYNSKLYPVMHRLVGKHVVTRGSLVMAVLPSDNTPVVSWATDARESSERLTTQCVGSK